MQETGGRENPPTRIADRFSLNSSPRMFFKAIFFLKLNKFDSQGQFLEIVPLRYIFCRCLPPPTL